VSEKRYRPIHELRLASVYPILQDIKITLLPDTGSISWIRWVWILSRSNSLFHHSLTCHSNKPSIFSWIQLLELDLYRTYNYADFYDLFGPTKFSRAATPCQQSIINWLTVFHPGKPTFILNSLLMATWRPYHFTRILPPITVICMSGVSIFIRVTCENHLVPLNRSKVMTGMYMLIPVLQRSPFILNWLTISTWDFYFH